MCVDSGEDMVQYFLAQDCVPPTTLSTITACTKVTKFEKVFYIPTTTLTTASKITEKVFYYFFLSGYTRKYHTASSNPNRRKLLTNQPFQERNFTSNDSWPTRLFLRSYEVTLYCSQILLHQLTELPIAHISNNIQLLSHSYITKNSWKPRRNSGSTNLWSTLGTILEYSTPNYDGHQFALENLRWDLVIKHTSGCCVSNKFG